MLKVIETTSGFGLKEIDADGNSVRMLEETFATEAEAQAFADKYDAAVPGKEEKPGETVSTDEHPENKDGAKESEAGAHGEGKPEDAGEGAKLNAGDAGQKPSAE